MKKIGPAEFCLYFLLEKPLGKLPSDKQSNLDLLSTKVEAWIGKKNTKNNKNKPGSQTKPIVCECYEASKAGMQYIVVVQRGRVVPLLIF